MVADQRDSGQRISLARPLDDRQPKIVVRTITIIIYNFWVRRLHRTKQRVELVPILATSAETSPWKAPRQGRPLNERGERDVARLDVPPFAAVGRPR
jgi:hypothetical protein